MRFFTYGREVAYAKKIVFIIKFLELQVCFYFFTYFYFLTSKEYNLTDDYSVKTSSNIKKREVYLIDKDGYVARSKININRNIHNM